VQISRECTPSYLSNGISNLLQPAQAEVVLGHPSTYLASWVERDVGWAWILKKKAKFRYTGGIL
jgi:hypothetical protein